MNSTAAMPPLTLAQRLRRIVLRWAKILLVLYLVVLLVASFFQEYLMFPGAWMSQGKSDAIVQPTPGTDLVTLTTSHGERIVARFGAALTPTGMPHPDPTSCPTIIYFYGNGDCLAATEWMFETFRQLPANVLIPEYVGYGMASGKPTESGFYDSAEAAYNYLLTRPDINPRRIVPVGWSLGAALACDLADKKKSHGTIAGLMMFSAFTSMDDAAQARFPFLPVRLFVRHHFRSIDKIRDLRIPILLMHGTKDNFVPYRFSLALQVAATASPSVTHIPIPGGHHNDFFEVGDADILPAMRDFLAKLPATPRQPASTAATQ